MNNKKCLGCGITMQSVDSNQLGYTVSMDKDYCQRCFRLTHYHDLKKNDMVVKFSDILSKVKRDSLVFFFVDFLNLHTEALNYFKEIKNPKVLVISKLDTIPKSIILDRIKKYLVSEVGIKEDIIFVKDNSKTSAKKVIEIMSEANYPTYYFLGITNSGKSSMVNSILELFGMNKDITVSELPNTTLDFIKIVLPNRVTIYDSAGITYDEYYKDDEFLLKSRVLNEIKPMTFRTNNETSFIISDLIRVNTSNDNSITFFVSNNLDILKVFKNNERLLNTNKLEVPVDKTSNVFIKGIGFIYVKEASTITLYGVDKNAIIVNKSYLGAKYD